jgi:hypothetical protein
LCNFNVQAAVEVSIRSQVKNYERPSAKDPRYFAYGHDVGELLLAAYGNQIKNQAGMRTLSAVEGALRSAVQAVGAFIEEPLFAGLADWIALDETK